MMFLSRYFLWNINTQRFKSLTVSETSIALRPFLFAVHPDLFGKYPEEQAINESSLKLLNEHINKLHTQQQTGSLHLTFHVRNLPLNKDSTLTGDFKLIKLKLDSQDVGDIVRKVLTVSGLSLDYLNAIDLSYSASVDNAKPSVDAGGAWKTYSGYENEYFFKRYKMTPKRSHVVPRSEMENSLNTWINLNHSSVITQMELTKPIQDEIILMKNELISRYQLKDIIWLNSWTKASFRTSLKGLIGVLNNFEPSSLSLKGHTITFSSDLGISVHGHIVLQRDVVSNSWTNMFHTLSEKLQILCVLPKYESSLSSHLGGFEIVRPTRSVILADTYLFRLKQLIDDILEFKHKKAIAGCIDIDTSGAQLSVECTTGSLMVSQSGVILIPSHCPIFLIFDFIRKKIDHVRTVQFNYSAMKMTELNLIKCVKDNLNLLNLIQDEAVTQNEMLICCRNLLDLRNNGKLTSDLTGINLRISQHYAVTVDGEMCIPWNFKL